ELRLRDHLPSAHTLRRRKEMSGPSTAPHATHRRGRWRSVPPAIYRFRETSSWDRAPRGTSDIDGAQPDPSQLKYRPLPEVPSLLTRMPASRPTARSRAASLRNDRVPETSLASPSGDHRSQKQTSLS